MKEGINISTTKIVSIFVWKFQYTVSRRHGNINVMTIKEIIKVYWIYYLPSKYRKSFML